ncbi:hypothetical protein ACJO1P_12555 [Vibrio parahaemolyticus]|uniref:hypothetical protein n=1 Tax=Vibrio parahaemolyticus TaxID=670 RepID=UPI00387B560B
MILISLAVHENVDVVVNQIKNLNKYIPDCYVLLHIARDFYQHQGDAIEKSLNIFANVYINKTSLNTGYLDGSVLASHLSNLRQAIDLELNYSYILLVGSNEMYVRYGLNDYIERYECSLGWSRDDNDQYDDGFGRALKDPLLCKLLNENNIKLLKRAPEGTFYSRELFENSPLYKFLLSDKYKIIMWFYNIKTLSFLRKKIFTPLARILHKLKIFNPLSFMSYATEEFYIPSLMLSGGKRSSLPVCYMDWDKNLLVDIQTVNSVNSGRNKGKFSVKRVERDINDPVRKHINSL